MPIWLTLILALPQIIKFVKEIYDLWKSLKNVPAEKKAEATEDFKETMQCMKTAPNDSIKQDILRRLRERLEYHKRT